ncbi:MAG: HAMP domain-containing protein [Clostridia bacterium]|nr:HAMP domain-containing protein [Clostridia bacterium]NCC75976.1 HAMP domain-containing protein [Clostridia bacterium]
MKLKLTLSLKNYMVLFISSVVVLMTLALLVVPKNLYESIYADQAENYSQDIAVQTSTGIAYALRDFDAKIDQLIEEPAFQLLVESDAPDSVLNFGFSQLMSDYLSPRSLDQYYVQNIDLYVKSSGAVYSYGSKPTRLSQPFQSDYMKQALVYPMELNWIGYNSTVDSIDISRLIYNPATYETEALLVIRMSVDFLLDKFNAFNTISIDKMFIADDQARVMGANDKRALGTTAEYADLIKNKQSGTISNSSQLIIFSRLEDVAASFPYEKWTTIVLIDKDILFANLNQLAGFLYAFAVVIAAMGIILAVMIAQRVSRPIGSLVRAMNQAQQGHLSTSLETHSSIREVSLFNHGFNEMTAKLNNLINTVYRIRLAEKEAQLRNLLAKINPHFLFNTLQMISWKAHEYEADQVCDMIHSLSYMLETELYADGDQTFTLAEELQYIEHYVKIIRSKYVDKIAVQIHVPGELFSYQIPKLVIQPILENAITHGLAPKTSSGQVSLEVFRDNEDMVIQVVDDGVGMRSNVLKEALNLDAVDNETESTGRHGIALANIQQRIHLLYGDGYGLTIASNLTRGTCVTLRIPLLKTEGKDNHDQDTHR